MAVQWTNLPPELIESIGECLDAEIDVLRFRAVCKQWRSLRPLFKHFPCGDVVLPSPFHPTSNASNFTLEERIVYRFELPDNTNPANFWLVKVERLSNGKLRIFNPASHHQIDGTRMPKSLNTLDFRIYEVCKSYALKCADPTSTRVRRNGEYSLSKKVIYKKGVKDGEYSVMAIDTFNKLWFINSGSDKWTMVPTNGMSDIYVDILNVKGRILGIDEWGCVWEFNSMLNPSPRIYAYSALHPCLGRNLVESKDGKLHLVEKVTGENICTSSGGGDRITSYRISEAVLDTRIWTMNRREWCGANPFNGLIIFTGDDCSFSFSSNGYRVYFTNKCINFQTQEERGPPRNLDLECNCCSNCQNVLRVYGAFVATGEVKRRFRELQGHNTGVSDFVTGKMGSLLLYHEFADIFWPPPPWLTRP